MLSDAEIQQLRNEGFDAAADEIESMRSLAECACGDGFTEHDEGLCVNCVSVVTAPYSAKITELEAEIARLQAVLAGPSVSRQGVLCDPNPMRWLHFDKDGRLMGEQSGPIPADRMIEGDQVITLHRLIAPTAQVTSQAMLAVADAWADGDEKLFVAR